MASKALSVYAGATAARRIAERGWAPELFSLLLGASGGPKWFVLAQLDRFLFGDYLQRSAEPLAALGSSVGSWRHACLTSPDPAAAVARFEQSYIHQQYSKKPGPEEISEVALQTLDEARGPDGARSLVEHDRIRTHIVTARGRGPAAAAGGPMLAAGMGVAALGNSLHRGLLAPQFQRVVFHSGAQPAAGLPMHGFGTEYCRLQAATVRAALHASGSIPYVLQGERDIPGAPPGQYWDGGIIDYHFDLAHYAGDGLILYPHFSARVVPGWFDKFLPWRESALRRFDKLVLLCPSEEFVAQLPGAKIPDRGDFQRLQPEVRIAAWEESAQRGARMAAEFAELIEGGDPLRGVTVLGPPQ